MCLLSAQSERQPPLIACWLMRPVSGTKRFKHVARCLTGNLHQAGKRLTHFQDQKNCTSYRYPSNEKRHDRGPIRSDKQSEACKNNCKPKNEDDEKRRRNCIVRLSE